MSTDIELDVSQQMAELIDDFTPEKDIIPSAVSSQLLDYLITNEPDLLHAWLMEHSGAILTDYIAHRLGNRRRRAVKRAAARAFSTAAATAIEDDTVSLFAVTYAISDDYVQRRVADMTSADHRYVARQYKTEGKHALMLAAFHEAVAKRLGSKKTSEVFTEEQYERLLQSLMLKNK